MRVANPHWLRFSGNCRVPWLLAYLLAVAVTAPAYSGDWPQILGPQRNGKAEGEQLAAWSQSGPPLVWSREVGEGFSGLAVVGERAVLFHRPGAELVAEALDAKTGKTLWQTKFAT